jgi:hypothetical protein
MARGNYLYAEDVLHEVFASKKQLSVSTIEAIGFGYLRSSGELLRKYLKGRMINWKTARELYGPQAGYGVHPDVSSDGLDYWCRESESAIQAALALARMDLDLDTSEVERMLTEIPQAMNNEWMAKGAIGQLKWVLFDKGVTHDLDELLPYFDSPRWIGADLATTLLKNERIEELRRLIIQGVTYDPEGNHTWKPHPDGNAEVILEHIGVTFANGEFCYWPIIDWLEHQKLLDSTERMDMNGYVQARAENQDPPRWWTWLSHATA